MKRIIFLTIIFLALFLLPSTFLTGQTPPPKVAEAAMNTGFQALQNSNWSQATESFDLVLMLAPNYAPAYIGKLCAELTVTEEKLLGNLALAIEEHRFFKSAMEHADAAYKQQIQEYAEATSKRLQELTIHVEKDNRKAGERLTVTVNSVEYTFRWCPAGAFMMGSPKNEQHRMDREFLHQVTLSRGFWMQETEVTQMMWASVMGNNPSEFKGMKLPVERVSWNNCQEYVTKLNDLSVAPAGFKFALPTEAQWEYACRAGTKTVYSFGNTLTKEQANFDGKQTKDVGSYPANAWGLQDMHGNVWEWCVDSYDDYPRDRVVDPIKEIKGLPRVPRGGGWYGYAGFSRSAFRGIDDPSFRGGHLGVRLSLVSDR